MSTNRAKAGFDPEAAVDAGVLEAVLDAAGAPDSVLTQPRNVRERATRHERRGKLEEWVRILGSLRGEKDGTVEAGLGLRADIFQFHVINQKP
jgi:hypothetical protein